MLKNSLMYYLTPKPLQIEVVFLYLLAKYATKIVKNWL